MRIKELTVERLRNLGNYENERLAVTVSLDEGDDPVKAVKNARKFIEEQVKAPEAPKAKR